MTTRFAGIEIHDKQIRNKASSDELRLLVEEALRTTDSRILRGWKFVFGSSWLIEVSDGRMIITDAKTIKKDKTIFLKVHKCFAHSAIFHEIGHLFLHTKFGDEDEYHSNVNFWSSIKGIETRFIERYCFPGYDTSFTRPPRRNEFRNLK